jgi:hypothetical protein
MTLNNYEDGEVLPAASLDNDNTNSLTQNALQLIETLTDRTVTYSKGQNAMIGEAYVDDDGRQDSVDTGSTTATFDTNKYRATIDTDVLDSDASEFQTTSTSYVTGATLTCDDLLVSSVQSDIKNLGGGSTTSLQITYNYTDLTTASSEFTTTSTSYTTKSYVNPNPTKTVSTVLFEIKTSSGGFQAYIDESFAYRAEGEPVEIYHDIPSGTFKPDVSSGFFCCKVADWEEGDSIDFKATNSYIGGNLNDTTEYSSTVGSSNTIVTLPLANALCSSIDVDTKVATTDNYTIQVKFNFLDGTNFTTATQNNNSTTYTTLTFTNTSSSLPLSSIEIISGGSSYEVFVTDLISTLTSYGSDGSGWIEGTYDGDSIKWPIEEFTAFTSEPTQYIIRLKPKSSSPTAGIPSISGSAILLE